MNSRDSWIHQGLNSRKGCDVIRVNLNTSSICFNSRTPGGVRRRLASEGHDPQAVSIHAPREGCDSRGASHLGSRRRSFNSRTPGGVRRPTIVRACKHLGFNSRTPGGVRRARAYTSLQGYMFQFTHPGGGATAETRDEVMALRFQFTHPGRGATQRDVEQGDATACFNSRTPGGVRLITTSRLPLEVEVSIHAPREGCDS